MNPLISLYNTQMTPGTSQVTSMVKRESSEVYRKKRFLFLSSAGNSLIKVIMIMTSITVKQSGYKEKSKTNLVNPSI